MAASEIKWEDMYMEAAYTCTCGSDTLLVVRSSGKVYLRVLPGFEYPEVTFSWTGDDIRVRSACACGAVFLFQSTETERYGRIGISRQ